MAGSLKHITDADGNFTMDLIENLGDAHEALEECFNKIRELENPLTGEVQDDSIPNAIKKIYSALREQSRLVNRIITERPFMSSNYGTKKNPHSSFYKDQVCVTWKMAREIAAKSVRDAIKELERIC